MSVNMYARMTKLTGVTGRVDYISNEHRQENLLAVAGTQDKDFWQQLAADSQQAWRQAGRHREGDRCCEAREIHGDLPNSALQGDLNELASDLAQHFTQSYGADCIVAIHQNKSKTNLHYHLIFSERLKLEVPEIKLADRNAFFDKNGIRKRTKKEILDQNGELRPGCSIIKKGEILSSRYFGEKQPIFASKGWLDDYKHDMAAWINEHLQPDEKRTVFDRNSPYLPQLHVGKGVPKEKEARIIEYNTRVKQFNRLVKEGRLNEKTAQGIKSYVLLAPDRLEALKDSMSEGAERTAEGPNEEKKRRLRELYRLAATERRAAKEALEGSLAWREHRARAREYSAEIDRLRSELGYSKNDEQLRAEWRKRREMRERREKALRFWSDARWSLRRLFWGRRRSGIDRIVYEYISLPPKWLRTPEQAQRAAELKAQIEAHNEAWKAQEEREWLEQALNERDKLFQSRQSAGR